jgi:hypothetical protein
MVGNQKAKLALQREFVAPWLVGDVIFQGLPCGRSTSPMPNSFAQLLPKHCFQKRTR